MNVGIISGMIEIELLSSLIVVLLADGIGLFLLGGSGSTIDELLDPELE